MAKRINRALIQDILSKGEGVKSISSEAVDWVISVAEHTARQLAASGRRTPGGRLMAPRMEPGLQARCLTRQDEAPDTDEGGAEAAISGPERWSDFNDWQLEVKQGKVKLRFEKWKEMKK